MIEFKVIVYKCLYIEIFLKILIVVEVIIYTLYSELVDKYN